VAVDAHGNSLDCAFTAAGDQIAIQVRGALAYPVATDPYWYAVGEESGIEFGHAVSSAARMAIAKAQRPIATAEIR
jgi:hypothetical protein